MEVLLINDTKLKIMLSARDCKQYKLDPDRVEYDDPRSRKIFWQILDGVKQKCGFDVSHDKVLIQLYPSKDGSCEVFVTKLGSISQSAYKSLEKSDKVALLSTHRLLYKFESLSELSYALRVISPLNENAHSEIYFADDGYYYLYITERAEGMYAINRYDRLLEFSSAVPVTLLPYLSEHARCIAENETVEIFANFS
jgi:negative regulator of genetic competence, sporulation and motility